MFLVDEKEKVIKMIEKDTKHCGKSISTDEPGQVAGKYKRLDITNQYKHPEGF